MKAKIIKPRLSTYPQIIDQNDGRKLWYYEETKGLSVHNGQSDFAFYIPWEKIVESVKRYEAVKRSKKLVKASKGEG